MERPGALAPGQIDRRAGRPRHELERSESEWSARAPWRPDKSTGVPVARDMSLSAAKADGAGDRPRTGYLNLGKVALYQVSYARAEPDSRFFPRRPRMRVRPRQQRIEPGPNTPQRAPVTAQGRG